MHSISELVIASHNAGKVREFEHLLAPFGVTVQAAAALDLPEPEETGDTFAENARIKAESAARLSGKVALSDDSGLAVTALDGAPGIYSARWAGLNKDFNHAMERVRAELLALGIPEAQWQAHFVCALAVCFPPTVAGDGQVVRDTAPPCECHIYEGYAHGRLTFPPRGDRGFGYDPIFIPEGHDRTFAEMDPEMKHSLSHRAQAMEMLINAWFPEVPGG